MIAVATRDQAKGLLKEKGRELAAALSNAVPGGHGYILILTDPAGAVFFTDASREEAISTLREVLTHLIDKRGE